MATTDFGAVIAEIVRQWDGVEVSPHRFGGVEFRVGLREIGHVHADGVADLEPPNVIVEDVVSLDAADFDISPADDGQSATYRWSYRPDGDAFYCGAEGDSPGTLLKLFVSIEDKAGFIAQLKVRSKPL